MAKRRVFIGSSTEGMTQAERICEILRSDPTIECHLWTEEFEPGFLTFEALERVLSQCCGAVFVAGPDDPSVIRGKQVKTPRANVMLEFGLMTGVMSRPNVALWLYGGAELPSDLKGLTVISPDPPDHAADPDHARNHAEQSLVNWTRHLTATIDRVPRTVAFHGYTGRWSFSGELQVWRGITLQSPSFVFVKGYIDLIIPPDGQTGRGAAHGILSFKIQQERDAYEGDYLVAHEVTGALCLTDGSLQMTTEAFSLQKRSTIGKQLDTLVDLDFRPEPWTAKWTLSPAVEPRTLEGDFQSEGSVISRGKMRMTHSL
jgi:hypothetical protein